MGFTSAAGKIIIDISWDATAQAWMTKISDEQEILDCFLSSEKPECIWGKVTQGKNLENKS